MTDADRILTASRRPEDTDAALRPKSLDAFVGHRIAARALIACLALLWPATIAAQDAPAVAAPKWAEAELERAVPADLKALGHHGVVTLEGSVSSEQRASELVVAKSSGSPQLDALALEKLGNARIPADLLAGGATRVRISVEYTSVNYDTMGTDYLCDQAVRDADWYRTTFPGQVEKTKFKSFLQGMGLVDKRMEWAIRDRARFETVWNQAIELCRERPEASLMGLVAVLGSGKTPGK